MMISYIILVMTAVSDGMSLAQIGLILNYLVLFLFVSNILYVLSDMLHSAFLSCKDRRNKKVIEKIEEERKIEMEK